MNYKHGMYAGTSGKNPENPTFRTWRQMIRRCLGTSSNSSYYKGTGIKVCERWLDFHHFLADMGERPAGKTLDRYPDGAGNYEPGNCRWATHAEQMRNTSRSVKVTFNGKTQCVAEWARELGIKRATIEQRLHKGWSVDRALSATMFHHLKGKR